MGLSFRLGLPVAFVLGLLGCGRVGFGALADGGATTSTDANVPGATPRPAV